MDDFENEQILTKKSVQLHNDIDSLISKLESLVEAVDIASQDKQRLIQITTTKINLIINEFETNKPLELPNLRSINLKDIELLIKNQRLLHLFVRWLSFIRIESNYFPSLRYTTYFTTVMNLFNHFNYLDDKSNNNVLSMIFNNYSLSNIKLFYQCLVFQGIFLVLLKNALNGNNNYPNNNPSTSLPKFKINLEKIYQFLLHQYQTTLNKI